MRSSARLLVAIDGAGRAAASEAPSFGVCILGASTFCALGASCFCCAPLAAGRVPPLDGPDFGSIRAEIFPFWVTETSNVPSAEVYSKREPPCASSACGWSLGAISRTRARICALVSGCFITGRAESFMVTVATSPSDIRSAVALLDTRMFRKRSSCGISVQWTNAIDQRTVDQPRFV